MSYASREASIQDGQPYFLYTFVKGATTYRYTSSAEEVTYASNVFTPATISHAEVLQTQSIERLSLPIDVPRTHPLAAVAFDLNDNHPLSLTIQRTHGDPDVEGVVAAFKGRMVSGAMREQIVSLNFETLHSTLRRNGLRARFQKTCRHVLYGPGCGVNIEDHFSTKVVASVTGNVVNLGTLSSSELPTYYLGGVIEYNNLLVSITGQDTHNLTLKYIPDGFGVSSVVRIAPGCPLNLSTCDSRFGNHLNFGGFPFAPNENLSEGFSGISLL